MDFSKMIGLGVAGNFTGHLEQAGEAHDFANIKTEQELAPKGIFPFYIPGLQDNFLGINPISYDTITMPAQYSKLQPEPEVALICNIIYDREKVVGLNPLKFAPYNDCSIRLPLPKISQKKNWGKNSKGIAKEFIEIDSFLPCGIMDSYRLVCFLKRDGKLFDYGEDSELKSYSYFYNELLGWIINKMNNQIDEGPLQNIHGLVKKANFPDQAIISIGATRYTEFGEKTYLEPNDDVFVVVYDERIFKGQDIRKIIEEKDYVKKGLLVLHQIVKLS